MLALIKNDKRARALIFMLGLCAVSIVLGLYLILAQDVHTRAQWSANVGALYFAQSGTQGVRSKAQKEFLQKAYEAQMEAVAYAPHDASLWLRLSEVLAAKGDGSAQAKALEALDIAVALDPHAAQDVERIRKKIMKSDSKKRGR